MSTAMRTINLTQIIEISATALFAGIAVAFWVAPESSGNAFGLAPVGAEGIAALRADLGGLFAALAVLIGAVAFKRVAAWRQPAIVVLGAIAGSRSIAWTLNGGPAGDVVSFTIEFAAIGVLAAKRPEQGASPPRPPRYTPRIAGASAILIIAIASAAMTPQIEQKIFDRAAQQRVATTNTTLLGDDALRVAICGSSAPLPSAEWAKACVAVFAGGKFYVIDVGPESVENLVLWQTPLAAIGGVLLADDSSLYTLPLGSREVRVGHVAN
jgi:hypothetical protein